MRIKKHRDDSGAITGYTIWLSAADTYAWARKPGAAWLGSTLSGERCMVQCDSYGLCDFTLNGRPMDEHDCADISGDEINACIADHLPADCRHLWPVWGKS